MIKDKYDKAIEFLTECPDQILNAWDYPEIHEAGSLFQYVAMSSSDYISESGGNIGCLTMIKKDPGFFVAKTKILTEEIIKDERMPDDANKITVDSLSVFAEWQRRIDKELGRV